VTELDETFAPPDGSEALAVLSDGQIDEAHEDLRVAVLAGLSRSPRSIPCRFFYDAVGAELFEQITRLEEYYPTRTETALLETYGAEIAESVGLPRVLVEFGSGSSRKTSLLIESLGEVPAYIPIDIVDESLQEAAAWLSERHDGLRIVPMIADFTKTRSLPKVAAHHARLGYFSGSTIGNLSHEDAKQFLVRAAQLLGKGSAFLIGVDLKKDVSVLIPAYNDSTGVTAAFNLNLLARINRELDGDFDLSNFAHEAVYNDRAGRIEIYIVSLANQVAHVDGHAFSFTKGERIHTENSHKYTVAEFQALARGAGWHPSRVWTDPANLFSLHLLRL
jgi:dimethylhistidine N-methyltransferase